MSKTKARKKSPTKRESKRPAARRFISAEMAGADCVCAEHRATVVQTVNELVERQARMAMAIVGG
jgi:hypothetical protein